MSIKYKAALMKKKYRHRAHIVAKNLARILLIGSFLSFLIGTIFSGYPILAFIWNISFPSTGTNLSKVLSMPIDANSIEIKENYKLPEKDLSLPEINSVYIAKIGVDTKIIEQPQEKYEDALRLGVWRVPDFGTPLSRDKTIILVAHRFGYINWSQKFRERNSFYNLPKLEVGDRIEIVWDQRKFTYEVYQKEEGEDISHYSADLILYTCRFLESDIRIFRYAKLIE